MDEEWHTQRDNAFWAEKVAGMTDRGLNAIRVGIQDLVRQDGVTQAAMQSITFDGLCVILEAELKRRRS